MLLQKRRLAVLSIITFFLMSFVVTPFSVGAEEIQAPSTLNLTTNQFVTLLEDYHVMNGEEEWGVIRSGAQLYVSTNAEGKKTIQFGKQDRLVNEEMVVESNESTFLDYNRYEENEAYPTVTLTNESIFADSEFTKEIGKITSEVEYPILNETDDHVEVIIGNVIGYVKKNETSKQLLDEEGLHSTDSLENGGVEAPFATQASGVEKAPQQIAIQEKAPVSIAAVSPNYFTVKDDFLSVYDNSSGSLVKVGALIAGQVYPKISTEGNWIKMKYGNGYGFVWKDSTVDADPSGLKNLNQGVKSTNQKVISSEYLSVYDNTSGDLVRFGSIQPNTKYPIIAPAGNWYKIDYAGRIGYIYKPAAKLVFNGNEKYFKVKTEFLSIYDNRSGSLKKVGSLNKDQEFPIVSFSGNWIKIKYRGIDGFVWKESTEPSSGTSIKNANKRLVTSTRKVVSNKYLSVYDNTSGSLVQFASIEPNTEYPIIETARELASNRCIWTNRLHL